MRFSGSHTQTVTAAVKAIPPERFATKVRNTITGLVFIAGAGAAAWKLSWPWYVVIPVAMLGGFFISQDLTKKGLELIVALVKDLLAAVRGKSDA